jgi:5-formyltetrahydrofolate cyclo-ligase
VLVNSKNDSRKIAVERVNNLTNKKELSAIITECVFSLNEYKKASSVMIYISLDNEVDTSTLISSALVNKNIVAVPITREDMHIVKIDKNTKYAKGKFNVIEPLNGEEIFDVDLAIIPMVGFDRYGARMGHGKGYFDKFLKDKNCIKVGVAYKVQEFERLETFAHDIKMDIIITEDGIVYNNL